MRDSSDLKYDNCNVSSFRSSSEKIYDEEIIRLLGPLQLD